MILGEKSSWTLSGNGRMSEDPFASPLALLSNSLLATKVVSQVSSNV